MKFLSTQADVWRALVEGKKVSRVGTRYHYMFNEEGKLIYVNNCESTSYSTENFDDFGPNTFMIYEEPKPKVKRAQYIVAMAEGHTPYRTHYLTEAELIDLYGDYLFVEKIEETEREFDF